MKNNLNKNLNIRLTEKQKEQVTEMNNFQNLVRDLIDVASGYDTNFTIDKDLTLELFFNESEIKKIDLLLNENITLINQYIENIETLKLENKKLETTKNDLLNKNDKIKTITKNKSNDLKVCLDKAMDLIQSDGFNELEINCIIENSEYFDKTPRTFIKCLEKQIKELDIPKKDCNEYLKVIYNVYNNTAL